MRKNVHAAKIFGKSFDWKRAEDNCTLYRWNSFVSDTSYYICVLLLFTRYCLDLCAEVRVMFEINCSTPGVRRIHTPRVEFSSWCFSPHGRNPCSWAWQRYFYRQWITTYYSYRVVGILGDNGVGANRRKYNRSCLIFRTTFHHSCYKEHSKQDSRRFEYRQSSCTQNDQTACEYYTEPLLKITV